MYTHTHTQREKRGGAATRKIEHRTKTIKKKLLFSLVQQT